MSNNKIYGGIYNQGPSQKTDQFIMDPAMTVIENKIASYYLLETMAHNVMLAKCGIVPKKSTKKILQGLLNLLPIAKSGQIVDPQIGDVHENVESKLTKLIGDDAEWFHIGRSRNDQTVTDQKLITKKYLFDFFNGLIHFETILWEKAEKYSYTVMPGFTHMRGAMPSSFGFWWQSYLDQILSIHKLLIYTCEVYDSCPLGAGASYGVNWKINTEMTANLLGFSKPFNNALSAINNRGIEDAAIISQLTLFLTILSRMMEDIIIWSLPELNYIAISEEFTTGSSIMPQKMNPDIAEKIKGKSAKLIANLNHALIAMKGTPSGYNRDSAESKIAILSSLEESVNTVLIVGDMISKLKANPEVMKAGVVSTLPTKLADELVKKYKIPFRTAHKIVGKSVGIVKGDISLIDNQVVEIAVKQLTGSVISIEQKFIEEVFDVNNALEQYQYDGTAGPTHVLKINKKLKKELKGLESWNKTQENNFLKAEQDLLIEVTKCIEK